jgi:hypothetical protein
MQGRFMETIMRSLLCLLLLVVAQPAFAGDSDGPYYGPMKRWHGVGFKFDFEDGFDKDGSWRVDAATRTGDAVDMAMYRTAERAREQGYPYVQLLGGRASRAPGIQSATVHARPSRSPAPPQDCPSKKSGTCYTADVSVLLRTLGGPYGTTPGVAVVDHLDEYGRQVVVAGYGIGAASSVSATSMVYPTNVPAAAKPPRPVALNRTPMPPEAPSAYDRALKAAQGVHGREPTQGWTVSD